uniref:Mediator of RNA polymerase II transcription subunit 31 n=1 Tax=Timema genevievae TaxID=629358 RepID=A0A7R9PNE3_TIMGE|nr:unnamed protein product [Timema genevievae]
MTAKNCFETDDQQLRFQAEQEFVQCLGDPNYLNFLAQRGYFKEKDQQRLRFQIELEFVQCLGFGSYSTYLRDTISFTSCSAPAILLPQYSPPLVTPSDLNSHPSPTVHPTEATIPLSAT